MYCPKCGAQNDDGRQDCDGCGANLAVVSDILRGRISASTAVDEDRLVTLLKDVYRGRRSAIGGGFVSLICLAKLAPILLFGLASMTTVGILLVPFLITGLVFLVWGLSKWNNASSEIKAINQLSSPANRLVQRSEASQKRLETRGDLSSDVPLIGAGKIEQR